MKYEALLQIAWRSRPSKRQVDWHALGGPTERYEASRCIGPQSHKGLHVPDLRLRCFRTCFISSPQTSRPIRERHGATSVPWNTVRPNHLPRAKARTGNSFESSQDDSRLSGFAERLVQAMAAPPRTDRQWLAPTHQGPKRVRRDHRPPEGISGLRGRADHGPRRRSRRSHTSRPGGRWTRPATCPLNHRERNGPLHSSAQEIVTALHARLTPDETVPDLDANSATRGTKFLVSLPGGNGVHNRSKQGLPL